MHSWLKTGEFANAGEYLAAWQLPKKRLAKFVEFESRARYLSDEITTKFCEQIQGNELINSFFMMKESISQIPKVNYTKTGRYRDNKYSQIQK